LVYGNAATGLAYGTMCQNDVSLAFYKVAGFSIAIPR